MQPWSIQAAHQLRSGSSSPQVESQRVTLPKVCSVSPYQLFTYDIPDSCRHIGLQSSSNSRAVITRLPVDLNGKRPFHELLAPLHGCRLSFKPPEHLQLQGVSFKPPCISDDAAATPVSWVLMTPRHRQRASLLPSMVRPRLDRRPGSPLKALSVQTFAPLSFPLGLGPIRLGGNPPPNGFASSQSLARPSALQSSHRIFKCCH